MKKNKSTKLFLRLSQITLIGTIFNILLSLLTIFFNPIPKQALIALISIVYVCYMILIYSMLTFIQNVYSIRPNQTLLKFLFIISGINIGFIMVSIFSQEDWILTKQPPQTILYFTIFIVILATFVSTYYGLLSGKKQDVPLIKASMNFYGIGSLIFVIGLLGIIIISSLYSSLTTNIFFQNILQVLQICYIQFSYTAHFQPQWFKERFEKRELSYIEDRFRYIEI